MSNTDTFLYVKYLCSTSKPAKCADFLLHSQKLVPKDSFFGGQMVHSAHPP